MSKYNQNLQSDLRRIKIYTVTAIVFWTIFNLIISRYDITKIINTKQQVLLNLSRNFLKKDLTYIKWNSSLGGIYGEINKQNHPNPYLKVEDKNITTPSGKKLTMIDPLYMTNQIYEISLQDSDIIGRIVSLNPNGSENIADEWEKLALKAIHSGKNEVFESTKYKGEKYFRYMAPIKNSYSKFHQAQDYTAGDHIVGISISIPHKKYTQDCQREVFVIAFSLGFLWVIGILLVLYLSKKNQKEAKSYNSLIEEIRKYHQLFESMTSGCVVLEKKDDNFIVKAINPKALDIENISKSDVLNKSIETIIPKDKNPELFQIITEVRESEINKIIPEINFSNKHSSGWREYQIFCMKNNEIVLIYRDKTLSHENEELLIILKRAVEQSTSLITITDFQGNILYANPMLLETTEYTGEEIKGKNARIFKSGEQNESFYAHLWEKILAGKTWYGDFHNKKKSGQLYWESSNISPVFNKKGILTHFVKIGKDITDTKLALDALQESESRYRKIVETSYDAMIIVHEDEILFFNHSFETLTGYTKEELMNKKFNQLIDKSKLRNEILATGVHRSEAILRKADNTTIEIELIKTTITDRNRENTLLIIRDITKQQEILQTLIQTLEKTKSLDGLIPICASCKSIRDEEKGENVWVTPEEYVHERLPNVDFTHSICPNCLKTAYPELYDLKFGHDHEKDSDSK